MADCEHQQARDQQRQMTLWAHFANVGLGLWLITSALTLGYLDTDPQSAVSGLLRINAERDLAPISTRNMLMASSDVISGALVMLFGLLSVSRRCGWAQWANAFAGVWLLIAPLVFWAPSAGAYANHTLVGSLVIAFAILVPAMPGMSKAALMDQADIPSGWQYSPSTWLQRAPLIALALVGFFISRYLTAYQLGHISSVWDPFFGSGTMTIIGSDVSRAWPVADAGLGAIAYMLEVLMGFMGDKRRWRTMPWMVVIFGILIVPLGGISLLFIIIQPIVIGTWCTLCLVAAGAMVIMIPYTLDEVLATAQFLAQSRRQGKPFWATFWRGGAQESKGQDGERGFDAPPLTVLAGMLKGGVNLPWTLMLVAALGVWLMFTRIIFGTTGAMADSDHLIGALGITVAITAMAEVGRPLRLINVLFGVWLIAAPWILSGAGAPAAWGSVIAGVLMIGLSLPRGPVRQHYGSWDRYIV